MSFLDRDNKDTEKRHTGENDPVRPLKEEDLPNKIHGYVWCQ